MTIMAFIAAAGFGFALCRAVDEAFDRSWLRVALIMVGAAYLAAYSWSRA